ncbi:DUF397 domain-containing protein [Pseudofrankia sp. BMG5.36]|uniref:DUF397 domain-containing protein n=1 Tax=Pseudofrankia sp. BMG5.36 TaxID=1834512 RepID=UPI0008D8F409|nr:DUF397 domain-containing protein [Pseudofrankia sp. BMG5.36]OHV64173.1 DUF397 domain-containing protein [Pseudofrankia sp. BMG5.36]
MDVGDATPYDDLSQATWRKSSHSSGDSQCVEVTPLPDGGRAVRDSKDPDGAVLRFTAAEWAAFLAGARDGEFDR